MNNPDSPSQTDEHEMSTEDQCDEYWKNQRGHRHSHSHEMQDEEEQDITPKTEDGDGDMTTQRVEFSLERMKTFDNVYDFMERLVMNKIQIEDTLKLEIQNCIDGGTLKLKSFEKALLTQKLLEL